MFVLESILLLSGIALLYGFYHAFTVFGDYQIKKHIKENFLKDDKDVRK